MSGLIILIPIALFLSGLGLAALLWTLRTGQFDDLEGDAERILFQSDDSPPKKSPKKPAEYSRIDSE